MWWLYWWFSLSLCFLIIWPGRLARSGREGGQVCTGWQDGPPPPEAKRNFNWSPQQSDLSTPDAKRKLFLIIKVFATHPPLKKEKKETQIGLQRSARWSGQYGMLSNKTKGKLRNSDQLVQYSGLVCSGQWSGLVLKGSRVDLISQEALTDLKSSVHKISILVGRSS